MTFDNFPLTQNDTNNITPPVKLVRSVYQHWRNKKHYIIDDFAWNGDNDTWMVVHREVKDFEGTGAMVTGKRIFVRSVPNFFGKVTGRGDRAGELIPRHTLVLEAPDV